MLIINVFKRREYFICHLFFLLNFVTFNLYGYCIKNQLLIFIYKVNFSILLLYYFYCIYMESEFDIHGFIIIQMLFEKYLPKVSLMANLAAVITNLIYITFVISFLKYQISCEYYINQIDPENKRELYNINNNNNYFTSQFMCSYNPYNPDSHKFPSVLTDEDKYITPLKCSDTELLINTSNNEIIEIFEPYEVKNIHYQHLKFQPKKYFLDHYKCSANMLLPKILMILHIYISVRYLILINIYFKNIKPNIIVNIVLLEKY